MSSLKSHLNSMWKSNVDFLRRAIASQQCPCSDHVSTCFGLQLAVVADCYLQLNGLTLDDVRQRNLADQLKGLVGRWKKFLSATPWKNVFLELKEADEVIVKYFDSHVSAISLGELQTVLNTQLAKYCDNLLDQACKCFFGCIQQPWKSDAILLRCLHQVYAFLGRMSVPDDSTLVESAAADFKSTISRIASIDTFTVLESLVLTRWLKAYKGPEPHDFHHGTGTTAEGFNYVDGKEGVMVCDSRISYVMKDCYPEKLTLKSTISRTSRWIAVPKSPVKLRGIAAEPATLQWLQQGVRVSLSRFIAQHKYLRRRICLANQDLNRDLACKGSRTGRLCTLDLTAASDSVSVAMLRKWIRRTSLWRWLIASRTEHCDVLGESYDLPMFGTMGSAVTFPIECIVFCAMCETSIMKAGDDPRRSSYRVYGDDIIIEQKYASILMETLEFNGFIPNESKSFGWQTPSPGFRESCGGEYYCGIDVGIARISRGFSGEFPLTVKSPASSLPRLQSLANGLFDHGLFLTRRLLLSLFIKDTSLFQFTEYGCDVGIWSKSPNNFGVKSRYYTVTVETPTGKRSFIDKNQGLEYRLLCIAKKPTVSDDAIAYQEWLRLSCSRDSVCTEWYDPIVAVTGKSNRERLTQKWVRRA